jgi:dihydrodipicolinate synthase/N-acetylneuraminate lyase
MSWDEHIMLIAHTVNVYGKELTVIGNTGSNSTSEAIHATEQGFAVGMHASLQINPYYGKTSMAGLRKHLAAVIDEGPAIVYNVRACVLCVCACCVVCASVWLLYTANHTVYGCETLITLKPLP